MKTVTRNAYYKTLKYRSFSANFKHLRYFCWECIAAYCKSTAYLRSFHVLHWLSTL